MKFAEKHNTGTRFDVDTTDREYITLSQLKEMIGERVAVVDCLYINRKGKYDDAPVIGTSCTSDGEALLVNDHALLVNLPAHMCDECVSILGDKDDVDTIKSGNVGIRVREYHSKQHNKTCHTADWVDIE